MSQAGAAGSGWDHSFDVVVVGSGAGGMAGAIRAKELGLETVLLEKADVYGGTTAFSGGGIWIPNNPQIDHDTPEEAWTYIRAATLNEVPEDRQRRYLQMAPKMLEWVHAKTRLRFMSVPRYADYNQQYPGAKPTRTMEPVFVDASQLGDELKTLRPPLGVFAVFGAAMGQAEAKIILSKERGWTWLVAKLVLKYWLDLPWRFKSKMDRQLKLGTALVGGLRVSMMDRNIPLWLNTPMTDLITENGRVVGVLAEQNGKTIRIQARRGVILASGGFERDPELRAKYLPGTDVEWATTPRSNTGDSLKACMKIGAATAYMNYAWWVPAVPLPGAPTARGLFAERSLPGCVIVNNAGKRFADEADDYNSFGWAMWKDNGANIPAWIIIDATFRQKYPCGPLYPGMMMPDTVLPKEWADSVYYKANSIAEIAAKTGIDRAGLEQTIANMNRYAQTGIDEEFHKGENLYDVYYGDPNVKPNPCLAPIVKPPFYALKVVPGDIGSKGGMLTDINGQVVDTQGQPIAGLYATGNCSAAVMGPGYPGPGSTLGPAMTFGFLAASHIAGANDIAAPTEPKQAPAAAQ